ncbi:MAG: hypothetical protein ACYSUX_07375 [Planctomycetota bacterium]|jgi:hypothetical protein
MEHRAILKVVLVGVLVVSFILPVQAASQSRSRRGGLYGDWQIKMKFGDREFESILSFSRNQEGQYTGQWISFWGMSELKDVKFEENKLSFTQVMRFGGEERTSKFTGAIEQGELSGLLVGDERETEIKGKRSPRVPRAAGSWEMKFKIGEQDITTTLVVKAGKEGKLTAEWQSQWGEHEITEIQYERGKLNFKRKSKFQEQEFESTFEGTIGRDNTLAGVISSEMGEVQAEGKLIGAPLIGTWNLDIESERGPRKQRLRVNSDMSALYGSTLIKKVNLDGDKVSFKYVMRFGDNEFEVNFEGKIADTKLTGELKTSRGTSKVTGTKRVFRRRSTR